MNKKAIWTIVFIAVVVFGFIGTFYVQGVYDKGIAQGRNDAVAEIGLLADQCKVPIPLHVNGNRIDITSMRCVT